jgi:Domain of unknown function (DUF5655)/Domain of unknown function (DUF4287)
MSPAAQRKSLYSVHPGVAMVQTWIVTLKEKTGRSLDEWLALVKKEGPADTKSRRALLKSQHKLGTNSAWWIADRAEGKKRWDDTPEAYLQIAAGYVEKMFSGGKAGLLPIYDRLLDLGLKTGKDAKACPCETIVPLYRNHVFAQIKPTTQTRIDMGFALKGCTTKIPKRLIDTGGLKKGDRITHRIPILKLSEIDAEVKRWLEIAYELDS